MTVALHAEELYEAAQRLSRGELDTEELRVMEFLQADHPGWVVEFHARLPQARASILRRLVESLLREDVLGLYSRAYEQTSLDVQLDNLHDEWLVIPVEQTFAFRRIEVTGDLLHRQGAMVRPLSHAVELLQLLHRLEFSEAGEVRHDWVRLAREMQNGTANLALALVYEAEVRKRLQTAAAKFGGRTSLELVEHFQAVQADFDAALFFERLCVEGHNLHPGAKTKMDMSARDVLAYAPEFGGRPQLHWVAVRREWAGWSYEGGEDTLNAALVAELPVVAQVVRREMKRLGLTEQEFLAIPVHPWQYEHVLSDLYGQELATGVVVPLPCVETVTAATSSFRTVVTEQGRRLAIKVAVNSQMTSTVRSISRNTAYNGPRFTRLIREVMRREPHLAETFVPICEVAGLYFLPDAAENDAELRNLKNRNLTAVWREDVSEHVRAGELAIVGTAYNANSPVSGRTVLEELVEAYAESMTATSLQKQDLETGSGPREQEAARQFLIAYAEIAVPGFLTLMVKYGIGLEAHLQNSVGVFQKGRPVRLLFRDWGGVRICRDRLERQGLAVDLAPQSVVLTDDVREMQNKLFYTLYQNHLAEMILLLCKRYGLVEAELWQEIRRISEGVFSDLLADPELTANTVLDRDALFRSQVEHKALTTMRLATAELGYCYAAVANPLHLE